MFAPNADKILASLTPADIVLDIGGWACPFNRANYVLDAMPYDTRGFYKTVGLPGSQGGDKEFFSQESWIVRDICDRQPFPFADKSIDFVICSHVLEDIRDPLWVCSEMMRIGKRGYIEVPSRLAETCRGWESDRIAGLTHHRWLIDFEPHPATIRFLMKHHMIHSERRFSLPNAVFRQLTEEQRVSWLFWESSFAAVEAQIHGLAEIAGELEGFVRKHYTYPGWRLALDRLSARTHALTRRVRNRLFK